MKKLLLLMVFVATNMSYANYINLMMPNERKNLFISVVEVAEVYEMVGKTAKAKSFYRSAVDIYPIGDEAHRIAVSQGMSLDDNVTYANFIKKGDSALESQKHREALVNYLMASELDNSYELYQKIAGIYLLLNDTQKAEYYNNLMQQSDKYATVVSTPIKEDEELEEVEFVAGEEFGENIELVVELEDVDSVETNEITQEKEDEINIIIEMDYENSEN